MEIKVLGTGCPKCKTLYKSVTEVVGDMGIEAEIKKVEDIYNSISSIFCITIQ